MPYCPKCGEKIPEKAVFCPNCGFEISRVPKGENIESASEDHSRIKIVGSILSILFIGIIAVSVLGSSQDNIGEGSGEGPEVVIDRTVNLEGDHYITYDLETGTYTIDIESDDGLRIRYIGGGVSDDADATDVKHYSHRIEPYDSTTLKIVNPGGILSNPTATISIKIERVE